MLSKSNELTVNQNIISVQQLYPALVYMHILDDDYVQLPALDLKTKKEYMLETLTTSANLLKNRFKRSDFDMHEFSSHLFAVIKITQKINAMLYYTPCLEKSEIMPMATQWCKTIEWLLRNMMVKEKIDQLSESNAELFIIQRTLLFVALDTLYLYISEKLVYHKDSTLEELNYAEWCVSKVYQYCLSNDQDILKKTFKNRISDEPKGKNQELIARYFLVMAIIESKRGSPETAIEYYEDFLKNQESYPNHESNGLLDRIYVNLTFILPKGLSDPNEYERTLNLLNRSVPICEGLKEFAQFNELRNLIQKTKIDLFSLMLKQNLKDKEKITFKADYLKDSLELTLCNDYQLKKPNNRKKLPVGISHIEYMTKHNILKLHLNLNALPLKFDLLQEQIQIITNLTEQAIIAPRISVPKPKKEPLPCILEASIPLSPVQETEKKAELTITSTTQVIPVNPTDELTEKFTKLILRDPSPEKSIKTHAISTPMPSIPLIPSKPVASTPVTGKQVGFKLYSDQTVIPVYFGFNPKKKSTNTYLVWDKVKNLNSEGEKHFKNMLNETGVEVAENIDDAGVKIHRPPSEKNDPNFAFIRLKSKSKLYGGTRVFAEFKEETTSILPNNEGKKVYLYSFGRTKPK